MQEIVGIGALNLDYIATQHQMRLMEQPDLLEVKDLFECGDEQPASESEVDEILSKARQYLTPFLGGSAFNVIRAVRATEHAVSLGFVGIAGSTRELDLDFITWLAENGVDDEFVLPASERSGICVSYIDQNERPLRTWPGANVQIVEWLKSNDAKLVDYLSKTKIIHVTSLFDHESPQLLADLLRRVKERNPWIRISFDPGCHWVRHPPRAMPALLSITDYLFLKYTEFHDLGAYTFGETNRDVAERVLSEVPGAMLVVQQSYDTVLLFYRFAGRYVELHYQIPAEEMEIEDATGAGDVFAAGFLISQLIPHMELQQGVKLGLELVRSKLRAGGDSNNLHFRPILTARLKEIHDKLLDASQPPDELASYSRPNPRPEKAPPRGTEEAQSAPKASDDYRSVTWRKKQYSFTLKQSMVVKALWDAWRNNIPEVHQTSLLETAESTAKSIAALFRDKSGDKSWKEIIVQGTRKGTFKLAFPPRERV